VTELPEEMLDPDAPPGTPRAEQSKAAPVYCRHGVRWSHQPKGYVADDAPDPTHPGHTIPARDVGAIPQTCQPTTVWDPADKPAAVLRREIAEKILDQEGLL